MGDFFPQNSCICTFQDFRRVRGIRRNEIRWIGIWQFGIWWNGRTPL